jgi:hypothetical protein
MMNDKKLTALEPTNLTEAMDFAKVIAQSPMVPDAYRNQPANVLVAVQWGYELGLAPMQALQNISVINGKPSIWGDSMLALVKAHPAFRGIKEYMDGEVAVCIVKRALRDGEIEETKKTFSMSEAKHAKLTGKGGAWQNYPNRMLQLRARGFALRDSFPDAIKGLITVEEARDYNAAEKRPAEKAVQAPSVASEGDTIENILTAVSEAESASNEGVVLPEFILSKPSGEMQTYGSQDEWASEYADLMLQMRVYDKLPAETRRSRLKELEECNAETLAQIDEALAAELKDKRVTYNKQLSMEAKEGSDEARSYSQAKSGV